MPSSTSDTASAYCLQPPSDASKEAEARQKNVSDKSPSTSDKNEEPTPQPGALVLSTAQIQFNVPNIPLAIRDQDEASLDSFQHMPNLPSELRVMIWKLAMGGPRAIQISAGVGPEKFNYPSKDSHAALFRLRLVCREANHEVLKKYRAIKFTDLYLGSPASLLTAAADFYPCILLDDKEDMIDLSLCAINNFLERFLTDDTNAHPQLRSISVPVSLVRGLSSSPNYIGFALWLLTLSGVKTLYAVYGRDFAPQMAKRFFKKDEVSDFDDELSFHEMVAERKTIRKLWCSRLARSEVLEDLINVELEFLHFEG